MAFKDYLYGCWKKEIRALLQRRLTIKDKIRHHKRRQEYFEKEVLPKIEKELNQYLVKAGNKI